MAHTTSPADRCCTCGRPRGIAILRHSFSLNCPTAFIPRTPDPTDRPFQITNDVICNVSVWRNGGNRDAHFCDDCLRIGLREIKVKVGEILGELDASTSKDAELAALTQRLATVQHYHQQLAYEYNRMQTRLGALLKLAEAAGLKETKAEEIRMAHYEVSRGPAIKKEDDYLFESGKGKETPSHGKQ